MKIAIIGSGIAGNVAARRLHARHEITVYEAGDHVGGHSHTHTLDVRGRRLEVDTGFIVFNDRTYPKFMALLDELGVASQECAMSFSVRNDAKDIEYNGTTVNSLFAQRRNILRPSFLAMVRDILRFNRQAPRLLHQGEGELPLGLVLDRQGYSKSFVDHYIIPMGAAIWSTSPRSMFSFPARFFIRFLMNHGMLTVNDRPQWRTVVGGSARYVEKLTAPFRDRIRLHTPVEWIRRQPGSVIVKAQGHEAERYDAVFRPCDCWATQRAWNVKPSVRFPTSATRPYCIPTVA
jgi:predicted NAD/FAD-binding protein